MAIEMDGGKVGDLEHLMVGMQRGIKANSEALVANGVASSEAALKGLNFEEYLTRVSKIADEMATPTDREQFLIQALGRSGATAGQQLKEFVEHLEKARGISEKGGIITDQSIERMEETKAATARLEIAQQKYAASVSSWATSIGNWFKNVHAGWLEHEADLAQVQRQIDIGALHALQYGQNLRDLIPDMQGLLKEEKEVAENDYSARHHGGGGAQTNVSSQDLEARKKAAAERQKQAEAAAAEDLRIQEACDESLVREHGEMLKYKANLDRQAAADAAALAKAGMDQAERDAKVLAENLKAQQKRAQEVRERNLAEWNAKQSNLAHVEEQAWRQSIASMTKDWAQGIQSMLHGQMSLSQGFKGALQQMESQTEMSLINMGLNWLKAAALQALIGKESHATQIMTDAKGAAAGAYNATVGIPFVGPFLAPAAAAVAFAGVMAFAEGGWDRVPSDQVAMIHKNEMVLPAHIAEPVRQMAAAGGGGGQQFHFHGVTDASWWRHNQGNIVRTIAEAARNGRHS
jgi:hypothetical protein